MYITSLTTGVTCVMHHNVYNYVLHRNPTAKRTGKTGYIEDTCLSDHKDGRDRSVAVLVLLYVIAWSFDLAVHTILQTTIVHFRL